MPILKMTTLKLEEPKRALRNHDDRYAPEEDFRFEKRNWK